jgi:copper transport protein
VKALIRLALGSSALAVLVVVASAVPAGAHAAVTSSSPAQGSHVARPPHAVTIDFDQPVQPDNGGLVVLDSGGSPVQVSTGHPTPATLSATLPGNLGPGAYVADYTVTSVDGHVVSGGIVFLVGHVSAGAGSITALTRPRTSDATRLDDFGQFLSYLGILTASGLAFFVAFILGGGPEVTRLRRRASAAAVLGLIGLLVAGVAQADLIGGGPGALAHWSIDSHAFGGKFGQQCAAQVVGLALCLVSFRLGTLMARQFAAFYGLLIAAGAFVLFGHAIASPERWLSIPADVVHVILAAMWAGGLVGMIIVLRARARAERTGHSLDPRPPRGGPPEPLSRGVSALSRRAGTTMLVLERPRSTTLGETALPPDPGTLLRGTAKMVGRFSTMAGISFAGIIVAGTLLATAEVGSVANLFETGYGQLLLVKIGLVGLLLFVAGYNRYLLLPGLLGAAADDRRQVVARGWQRLLSTVRVEGAGMVAVLGVTTVLANGTPSNGASLPPPVPFEQTQAFDGGHVTLRVSPNQALVNDWTVRFTGAGGALADLAESVSLYLVEPLQNIGPVEEDMKKTGVGQFVLHDSPNPPVVGTWQIVLQVQVSEFSQPDVSFVDTVQ